MARRFTQEDQDGFAALSGDHNPLHVDAIAARRTIFGNQVVHGMHVLLWALDRLGEGFGSGFRSLRVLDAAFRKPVTLHRDVTFAWQQDDSGSYVGRVTSAGATTTEITLALEDATENAVAGVAPVSPPRETPGNPEPDALSDRRGSIALHLDASAGARLFPSLGRVLSIRDTATLLGLTRVVGMKCPGLHSIFSSLRLDRGSEGPRTTELTYQVQRWDARLSFLEMAVSAGDLAGTVQTFRRPPPARQPAFEAVRALCQPDEFSNQRALVVGGSRGLGELTAKILAAGGADVTLTYSSGGADADRVRQECVSGGARVAVRRLDILEGSMTADPGDHNALYYFATPPIQPSGPGIDPDQLRTYMDFYVFAPFRLMSALSRTMTHCFYPSTVFLDTHQREFREYCIAKAAGEEMVRHFASNAKKVAIIPRLPRLATDQTQALTPRREAEATTVMLGHIRDLARAPR